MKEQDPFKGWGAKRDEQLAMSFGALAYSEFRKEIPCKEARQEWFIMAREMYVANNPEPRFPIDLEVGWHIRDCPTEECQQLVFAYKTVLRSSHPADAEQLRQTLDSLEMSILPRAEE